MKEKINIAQLLKDCPKGMELDCTMFFNPVYLKDVIIGDKYSILIEPKSGGIITLTDYGAYVDVEDAKCIIFPKGKTTWEGFVPPYMFKDGDVVVDIEGAVIIYKGIITSRYCGSFVSLDHYNQFIPHYKSYLDYIRLATEEEKQKLFDAIKDNGYKWNPETKTLENLKYINNKMKATIQWDGNYHGVHILTSTGTSLIVNARPSLVMNWYDAVSFFKDEKIWSLPTKEDLRLIYNNLKEVNTLMKVNGGYEIDGTFWTADGINEYFAYNFSMNDERLEKVNKYCPHSVRGVNVIRR